MDVLRFILVIGKDPSPNTHTHQIDWLQSHNKCIYFHFHPKGDELLEAIDEIKSDLPDIPVCVMGKSQSQLDARYQSLDDLLIRTIPVPVCKAVRKPVPPLHPLCYIYTSGTTGQSYWVDCSIFRQSA